MTIQFSWFNFIILYKINLYKYEGRIYILTTIIIRTIRVIPHDIAGHGHKRATSCSGLRLPQLRVDYRLDQIVQAVDKPSFLYSKEGHAISQPERLRSFVNCVTE